MPIDPTITGLPEDTFIDGTELIELIGRDGRKVLPLGKLPGRVRSMPLRVVLFGDSTANAGILTSPESQDVQYASVANWQNGLVLLQSFTNKWAVDHFYPQAWLVGACGISGQTSGQQLARSLAAPSITRRAVQDALDLSPDVIIHRGLSVNDITTITTEAQLIAALATARDNIMQLYVQMRSGRVPVIVVGMYGYDVPSAALPLQRRFVIEHNAAVKEICAGLPDFYFIDPVGIIGNATGGYAAANLTTDGIHASYIGQLLIDKAQADVLTRLFGPSSNARYRGVNRFADPMFLTTTAQSYGTMAGGLTINFGNAVAANPKLETIDGIRFQTIEVTATANSASARLVIPYNPTATGLNVAAGDIYGFEYDFMMEPLADAPSATPAHRVDTYDATGGGRVVLERPGGLAVPLDRRIVQHVTHQPLRYGDAGANLTTASGMFAGLSDIANGARVKMGIGAIRAVKLN